MSRNKPMNAPDGTPIQRGLYKYENAKGRLQDQNDDGMIGFGDTWLGDLLGSDGQAGVQGAGLRDSRQGARRTREEAVAMVQGQGLPVTAANVARAQSGANTGPQPAKPGQRMPSHSDQPYNIDDATLTGDPPEQPGFGAPEYAQAGVLAATALAARRLKYNVPPDGGPALKPDENGEVTVRKERPAGGTIETQLPVETAVQQGYNVEGHGEAGAAGDVAGATDVGRVGASEGTDTTAGGSGDAGDAGNGTSASQRARRVAGAGATGARPSNSQPPAVEPDPAVMPIDDPMATTPKAPKVAAPEIAQAGKVGGAKPVGTVLENGGVVVANPVSGDNTSKLSLGSERMPDGSPLYRDMNGGGYIGKVGEDFVKFPDIETALRSVVRAIR